MRGFDNETATAILAVRSAQAEDAVRDLLLVMGDINSTEVQVKVAGDALPQAKADLDQLRTAIVELDNEAGRAGEGVRKVGAAGSEAGGIVSNTMGNAAQDIAQLAGVSGTAGQAVGQMAESFITAASGAGGLAAGFSAIASAAAPIVGVAAVVGIITSVLGEMNAMAEASAAQTKAFGDAMAGAGNDALGFTDAIRGNEDALRHFAAEANSNLGDFGIALEQTFKKIPLLGSLVDETSTDVVAAMGKAQLSVYDLGTALDDNVGGMAGFIAKLQDAKNAGRSPARSSGPSRKRPPR